MPAAAGSRPRSSRGGRSRTNLAYDLGRRGENAPGWLGDNPEYADAYERGVSDLDAGEALAPRRHRSSRPATPSSTSPPSGAPRTLAGEADAHSAREAERRRQRDDGETRLRDRPLAPSIRFTATGGEMVAQLASALGGLTVYAVLINFARGGWPRVTQWFYAKITNNHGTLP